MTDFDEDNYQKYQHHRKWFNKLWIAELFKYDCGPNAVPPSKDGTYVVRPIYNLSGMGVGATVKELKAGDKKTVPPGYFWCEFLTGKHYSANYKWKVDHITGGKWEGVSCWEGTNMPINLSKFSEWKRSEYIPEVPAELKELYDVEEINVEFKGNQVIEVHLRTSPDPDYDHFIPVWKSDEGKVSHYLMHGFKYIEFFDDADGHLKDPRVGFLVK